MREEYRGATLEAKEMAEQCIARRSKLSTVEQQLAAWKDVCRLVVTQNRDKKDRYETEIGTMKTDMSTMTPEMGVLRTRATSTPGASAVIAEVCASWKKGMY